MLDFDNFPAELASEPIEALLRDLAIVASLVIQVYDLLATYHTEYKYIWRAPPNVVNSIHIFSRYFGIVSQLSVFVFSVVKLSHPNMKETCEMFLALQLLPFHIQLCTLEIILILRVYALYTKRPFIGISLLLLFLAENSLVVFFGWVWSFNNFPFSPNCILSGRPPQVVIYANLALLSGHFSILCMTIVKLSQYTTLRDASGQCPQLIRVLLRDGTFVFFGTFTPWLFFVLYAFFVGTVAHIAIPLLSGTFTILTCRLILNMQSMRSTPPPTDGVALTTCFAITEFQGTATTIPSESNTAAS
ncbi:hypothetical protein BDN72DRAFT_842819 [Pluteus cervinus]|uniref:Uncharacterized protein n=1 Tax=Pluteus cervinus TaxID=181527 RepID=A0ACD3AQQ4_9AGAR|nr:hypothetical protein BDN72DRAFT_842819 [Pluteus cervinus]